jgi:hypothetical protein
MGAALLNAYVLIIMMENNAAESGDKSSLIRATPEGAMTLT